MKYPQITAAIVTALAASSAHALNVADTIAAPVQLVAAGASAARDSVASLLQSAVCTSGSLTAPRRASAESSRRASPA